MGDGDADRSSVRAALERVLASRDFDASDRNRRFLSFVVLAVLEGRAEQIKAYTIGTEVFGRGEGFDPQADPIVRIEARRLRRSLEHYYLTSGRLDPIVISVPRGSYVPLFSAGGALVSAGAETDPPSRGQGGKGRDEGHGPAIFVAPFEDDDDFSPGPSLSRGLTREIISRLVRFEGLRVFGGLVAGAPAGVPEEVDYVLSGGVGRRPDGLQVTASLVNARTNHYIWSDRFQAALAPAEFHAIRDEVADRVVEALASPYGVMFTDQVRELQGKPPERFTSYESVLLYYEYWKKFTPGLFELVRSCLERTVAAEPTYAEALAALASVYADAYRFNFPHCLDFDLLDRSLHLARRAVELAPLSGSGHRALHHALWFKGEVSASIDAAERALALNRNNTDVMADLGMRLCFLGEWDRGVALLTSSYQRNPSQASHYRIGLVYHHCMNGRYAEALLEAEKIYFPDLLPYHMMLAPVYALLGRMAEARAAVAAIIDLDPAFPGKCRAWLASRNICPALTEFIVDGLRRAGMPIAPEDELAGQEGVSSLIEARRERAQDRPDVKPDRPEPGPDGGTKRPSPSRLRGIA
jgi:adenylate cyclase